MGDLKKRYVKKKYPVRYAMRKMLKPYRKKETSRKLYISIGVSTTSKRQQRWNFETIYGG
jgi:hypothetical protein